MKIARASIWAQDTNGVLGDGSGMLWHVPADFQFFKSQTMGCPVIMGRTSFEALGTPLPGRDNLVLTRDRNFRAEGAIVVTDLAEAFSTAEALARKQHAETVWVAGGASIYEQTMPLVDRLVVSFLDLTIPPSSNHPLVSAPPIDAAEWKAVQALSDSEWRPKSGDARWQVKVFERR